MNTRLQVEHPITEQITNVDLVEQMIRIAAGERIAFNQEDVKIDGWAFESRVYAENPLRNFLPSIGLLTHYTEPSSYLTHKKKFEHPKSIRCDSGIREGSEISMYYDPMICKLVTWGNDRLEALDRMRDALDCYKIRGLDHNICFLRDILDNPRFIRGELSTKFIPEEYPNGFKKVLPTGRVRTNLVASAAVLQYMRTLKNESINEQLSSFKPTEGLELRVQICTEDESDQVVHVNVNTDEFDPLGYGDLSFEVNLSEEGESGSGSGVGKKKYVVNWNQMDNTVYNAQIGVDGDDGEKEDVQDIFLHLLRPTSTGFKVMYHGFEYEVKVLTPRQYELAKFMIPKVKPDMSKYVLSPMPGSVIDVLVKDGQTIEMGQNLLILEAMKMQNVIKSDKNGVIKSVVVKKGANVENDAVLIEWQE